MTTYVEFDEPWGEVPGTSETLHATVRIEKESIIRWQRAREPRYTSDEQALDDFLVVHWARLVEVPDA